MDNIVTKKCRKCGEGFTGDRCRPCARKYEKEYRYKNKDKLNAYHKKNSDFREELRIQREQREWIKKIRTTKVCTLCRIEKPLSDFYIYKKGLLHSACKECEKNKAKKWRLQNLEKYRAKVKLWKKENPDKAREQRQRNRRLHPERNREQVSLYKKRYPEKNVANQQKRRARQKVNGGNYSASEWVALLEKYDNKCLCCGEEKKLTVDHVVPLFHGGTNSIDNIQPLCKSCNSRKGTKTIDYRIEALCYKTR